MKTARQRLSFALKLGLPRAQAARLARLKTPAQIQDFINKIPANFEPDGDTCMSVTETLRRRRAHCAEACFVAACALWINGRPPLLMDLRARGDYDHVVALFREHGRWGAISKSNHIWLRWRDPVYRSLRELAMSYFHEYSSGNKRTLWAYSAPFDLRRFAPKLWVTKRSSCWPVAATLDNARHYRLISSFQVRHLRAPDALEKQANDLVDYQPSRRGPKRRKRGAKGRPGPSR